MAIKQKRQNFVKSVKTKHSVTLNDSQLVSLHESEKGVGVRKKVDLRSLGVTTYY